MTKMNYLKPYADYRQKKKKLKAFGKVASPTRYASTTETQENNRETHQ